MTGEAALLTYVIEAQQPTDEAEIEQLLDRAFGPDRLEKTAYRLRQGVDPVHPLSFLVRINGRIVGTIRFWPIVVAAKDGRRVEALLLGPLAVDPDFEGQGIGQALMRHGLQVAHDLGHRVVILVGDYDYYAKVGFYRMAQGQLTMPGPVDPDRLLILDLVPGSMDGVVGDIIAAL